MAVIHVTDLTKVFDGNEVVRGLNFQLEKGKCTALLGPNGAGKTTTLRMLSGLLRPTDGMISFEGLDQGQDFRERIGYLPQYPVFYNWMTGKEFLIYAARLTKMPDKDAKEKADYYLEKVGIPDAANRRIGKYSGGMKQRLGIAQALIHQPELLILDEPVSSLDPIGRREILDLMMKLKEETTILFSTHILSDAEEVSDELLLMANGSIVESGNLYELQDAYRLSQLELSFKETADPYYEILKQEEGVQDITIQGREIRLVTEDIENTKKVILRRAVEGDWPITRFEVSRTSLEDLFMRVVKS